MMSLRHVGLRSYAGVMLLAAITDNRLGHAWELALSGLRRGEIAGLRWSDIDLEAKSAAISMRPCEVTPRARKLVGDSRPRRGCVERLLMKAMRSSLRVEKPAPASSPLQLARSSAATSIASTPTPPPSAC